jgi:hypothetical protein
MQRCGIVAGAQNETGTYLQSQDCEGKIRFFGFLGGRGA